MNPTYKLVAVLSGFQPSGERVYQRECTGTPIQGALFLLDEGYTLDPRNYEIRQSLDGNVYVVAVLSGRADGQDWHERLPMRGFQPATAITCERLGIER